MVVWCIQAAAECIVHHNVTLNFNDSSCVDMSVSVPWPGTTASLTRPSSCPSPLSVTVRAVNSASLVGPAALVLVPSSTERPPPLLFQTTSYTPSLTSAIFQTSTVLPSSLDNTTERELVYSSCTDGSKPCQLRRVDSRLCSVYLLDGRVLIVNRTETTIAVQLTSSFNISLHSGLILVRNTRFLSSLLWK